MKGPIRLLLAAAIGLVLSACTGTGEQQLPTLLIVGIAEGGEPRLALIEDTFTLDLDTAAPRLRFVEGSRRTLPAPAVSIDIAAREIGDEALPERGVAWVLMREVTGSGATLEVRAFLQSFSVSNIDPDDPIAFAPLEAVPIPLTGAAGAILEDGFLDRVSCPSAVSSSRDGTRLLVLDDPEACGLGPGNAVVWEVDPAAPAARQLPAIGPVVGRGPYTDQRLSSERGYYLVEGVEGTRIYVTDFDELAEDSGYELPVRPTFELRDFAGSGTLMIALTDVELVAVDLREPASSQPVARLETLRDGIRLVADPTGSAPQLLVIGSSRVQLHDDLEDDDPRSVDFRGVAGTIEQLQDFAYVLGEGSVLLVDLYPDASLDRNNIFPVDELTFPRGPDGQPISVISWVRSAEPPPAP